MESLEGMKIQLDGIAHVLADNRLSVPRYQRSYAWETKNITDLFNDLADAIRQNAKDYFLGSIVITGTLKDTAGEPSIASSRLSKSNERWGTSPSKWSLSKPSRYPRHIESGGNQKMKEPRLWKTDIATAAQVAQPDAL